MVMDESMAWSSLYLPNDTLDMLGPSSNSPFSSFWQRFLVVDFSLGSLSDRLVEAESVTTGVVPLLEHIESDRSFLSPTVAPGVVVNKFVIPLVG